MEKLLELQEKNDKKANTLFFIETCIIYAIFVAFMIMAPIFTYIKFKTISMIILGSIGGVIALTTIIIYASSKKFRIWKYLRWVLLIENALYITLFTFPISIFAYVLTFPIIISLLYSDKKFTIITAIVALLCNIFSEIIGFACRCFDLNVLTFPIGTIIEITEKGFYIDVIEKVDFWEAVRTTSITQTLPTVILYICFGVVAFIIVTNDQRKWLDDVNDMYSSASKEKEEQLESHISQNLLELKDIKRRKGFEIDATLLYNTPSSSNFYDYFLIDENHFCFLTGSTSLVGIEAVTFISIIKSTIRNYSEYTRSAKEILAKTNNSICKTSSSPRTCSLFLGILHTRNGLLDCCDAGGFAPLIFKDDKYQPFYIHRNPLIGLSRGIDYGNTEIQLQPNDRILLIGTKRVNQEEIIKNLDTLDKLAHGLTKPCDIVDKFSSYCKDAIQTNGHYDLSILSMKFNKNEEITVNTIVEGEDDFDSYGGISVVTTTKEMKENGITYGDLVKVIIGDLKLTLPVVPSYTFLLSDKDGLVLWPNDRARVSLITFAGNFRNKYGFDPKNIKFPMPVKIVLFQKAGYKAEMELRDLNRTNDRHDYLMLTDEDYSNFRNCAYGDMKPGILYRGSSPITNKLNRDVYLDNALAVYGIRTVINLTDTYKTVSEQNSYKGSYYSKLNVKCYGLDTDYYSKETMAKLKQIFIDIANNEAPFYVHCIEGQDRTGYVIAVLECLLNINYDDMISDFMRTYMNYYKVEENTVKYNNIAQNLVRELEKAFNVNRLSKSNLREASYNYLLSLGISEEEINKLINKLKR